MKSEEFTTHVLHAMTMHPGGYRKHDILSFYTRFFTENTIRKFLSSVKNKNLAMSKVIGKESVYFITTRGMEFLRNKGVLDSKEAYMKRRAELIKSGMDLDEKGDVINSKKNGDAYFLIIKKLYNEFYKKDISIDTIRVRMLGLITSESWDADDDTFVRPLMEHYFFIP